MTVEEDDVTRDHMPTGAPEKTGPHYSQGRYVPAPFVWEKLSLEQQQEMRRRQRSRSIITALCLGALVVQIFAIALTKIANGTMQ